MATNKISLSLGANLKQPPPTNGVKRPRAALQDEEDEGQDFGRSEEVSHFDKKAGGAIDQSKKKEDTGPLIIAKQSNRDWREAANTRKRQKSGLPDGAAAANGNIDQKMKDVEAADAAKKPGFGLNLYKNQKNGESSNGHTEESEATVEETQAEQDAPKPRTDDELAMDALLGKTTSDKTLTIDQAEPLTESDAFKHDFRDAPEMATLDEYARVPVEQFGAALLRGMGWKDGEGIGSQRGKKMPKDIGSRVPERRAALLGIGANEDSSLAAEMGAWGKHAKGGKEVKIYNPVLLRDKKTGEMFTEDELKKKQEQDERAKYEEEFDRKEKDKERRRRRDEDESHDRRRGDSRDRRREKERDRDDRRDRDRDRRKREEESDDEYYRRKEKERRKRKERESRDDDYDRERSRRHRDHDDDRDRRRDREKDRRR